MRKLGTIAVTLLAVMLWAQAATAKDITLNFKNADIRAFIEFVAGFSGKNFLVDNRVKGNVTIVSPAPISEQEAYDVFLSVLEVNGFATVPSGSVIKIVPRSESKQESLPVHGGKGQRENDAMVTQVIRLQFADAQQLVSLIRPLISPNSHLVAYPRGNMLLLTDSASNIARIKHILTLLDRKDAVGVQLFALKHASADKLATTLTSLYTGGGAPGSPSSVKALAHQPGNTLVVVAEPQILNEVAGVVERLDVPPESDSGRLQVRYLKHANAEDVAKVLNELVGGTAAQAQGKPLFSGDVKVVPEKGGNALLITADPSDIASVDHIIDKLDIRRRQVLVEALIVEVTGNMAQQFGVEWQAGASAVNGKITPLGGTSFNNQAGVNIQAVSANPAAAAGGGLAVGAVRGVINLNGTNYLNLVSLARALETKGDANVLSTPNLLTMDNEEAEIIVGKNVPFLTGSTSTQGGVVNPFQTVERKDIGITLRVTPQISEGDTVQLQLYQEISSIAPSVTGAQDLITNKRSIKTAVLANDGQVIVLGGLMQDDNTASVQRVPCIGAMPILGEPFKFTDNQHTKTNLMVFLKPHIIKSADQIDNLTNQKYSDIRKLYEKPIQGGTIIFPEKPRTMPEDLRPDGLKMDAALPEKAAAQPAQ